jgi:putative flippase GtrA
MNTTRLKEHFIIEVVPYFSVSAFCLLLDYFIYWLLAFNKLLSPQLASVMGYSAGFLLSYFLMSQRVFKDGWMKDKKHIEFILFVASGFVGALLTYVTVKMYVIAFGLHLAKAKIVAIGISFVCVYTFRKIFVFRKD